MNPPATSGRLDRAAGRTLFGIDAAGYHSGRIGYPDELYDHVLGRTNPAPRVLEIGAGTGLATEGLLYRGAERVTAVEPDPALCRYLAKRLGGDRLTVVNAPFLDAALAGSFDLAVAAASFHWMEPAPALAKIAALLRPGGICALWWNTYRVEGVGDPFADAVAPLLMGLDMPPSEGATSHYSLDVALHTRQLAEAGFGDIRHAVFRRERWLDAAAMRALYASYSFVRTLPPGDRDDLLCGIGKLVDEQFGGSAPNVVLSAVYSAVATI